MANKITIEITKTRNKFIIKTIPRNSIQVSDMVNVACDILKKSLEIQKTVPSPIEFESKEYEGMREKYLPK